ncbi:MAG: hypothetical protein QNJ44_21860 [Rhodobacter sp.]|nr:hypothetical protein [Rhodobacter sp.]
MSAVLIDPKMSDDERRAALYHGDLVFYSPTRGMTALCDLAWNMIVEAFHPIAPERAQFEMPVEEFVEVISKLKPAFTHHPEAKQALLQFFEDIGADPELTYFDVPKLRIVSTDGYLTAGMGYAYKAHRDIWYACPESQINWWTPIRPITERRGLAFYPARFGHAVENNSHDFDAYQWNADGRKNAGKYINSDPRPHPRFQGESLEDPQIIIGDPASVIGFSAQHLHATVPNDSGETRFSIDFRTVHRQDIIDHKGAALSDNKSTGTTLRDFMRATDHVRFDDDIVATYDDGKDTNGVLVFQPEDA